MNLINATVVEILSEPYNPYENDVAFTIDGDDYYCMSVDILENGYGHVEKKTKTFCSMSRETAEEKARNLKVGDTYTT